MQELVVMSREEIKKLAGLVKQYKDQKIKMKQDYYYKKKKISSMIKDLEKRLKEERNAHKKRGPIYLRHRNKKIYNAFTKLLGKHRVKDINVRLAKKFKRTPSTIRRIIKKEDQRRFAERKDMMFGTFFE